MITQSIMDFIIKLLTKDNITFALAVFGSVGTAYTLFSQRRKFSVSVHYYNYENKALIMYVSFTNNSHLPISISNVSIVIDNVCYPCVYVPTKILDYTHQKGKEVVGHKEIMSYSIPSIFALSCGVFWISVL